MSQEPHRRVARKIGEIWKGLRRRPKESLVENELSMPLKAEDIRLGLAEGQLLFSSRKTYSGVLKLHLARSGLKDRLYYMLATTIAHCIEHDLYLAWDGNLGRYGNWNEWFEPFIEPARFDDLPQIIHRPIWKEMTPLFLSTINTYPPTFIRHIWRLNEPIRKQVDKHQVSMIGTSPYAAVQVRRGDKLRSNKIQLVPAKTIISNLPRDAEVLFVATDDYTVLEELRAVSNLKIVSSCQEQHRGATVQTNHFHGVVVNDPNGEVESRNERETFRLLSDLEICRRANCFIRIVPNRRCTASKNILNYQISDMISDLRHRKNEIHIR